MGKIYLKLLAALIAVVVMIGGGLCACKEPADPVNEPEDPVKTVRLERSVIGIGGGGAVFLSEFSPFDKNVITAVCDMGGVYVSHDYGESFFRHNISGRVYAIEYDESNEGVVYYGGDGLFKSEDNGSTYSRLYPKSEDIMVETTQYENSKAYLYTSADIAYPTGYTIQSILVDPLDSAHIYILFYGSDYMLYESTNGGDDFSKVLSFARDGSSFHKLLFDGQNSRLIIATAKGVFTLSDTAVEEAQLVTLYTPEFAIHDIAVINGEASTDFVVVEAVAESHELLFNTAFTTKDFITNTYLTDTLIDTLPRTFVQGGNTLTFKVRLGNIAAYSTEIIYFSQYSGMTNQNGAAAGTSQGIVKFADSAFTWLYGHPFKDQNSGILSERTWNNGVYGPTYGMDVFDDDPNIVVFSNLVGIYTYQDGKVTPKHSDTVIVDGKNTYKSSGIDVQTTYSVQTDPFDDEHLMMPCTDLGLIESRNGGESWRVCQSGINSAWLNTCYDLYFNRSKKDVVYSLWASRHDAPYNPSGDEITSRRGGFAISHDGGTTWDSSYSEGLPATSTPLKMSVVEGGDSVTIYVATFNHGFFASYDEGKTFESLNEGLEKTSDLYIFGIDVEAAANGRVFALEGRSAQYGGERISKLYELKSGKLEQIALPEGVISIRDIIYNQETDTLYLAATPKPNWVNLVIDGKDVPNAIVNKNGGVFSYKDGEFTQIFDQGISVFGLAFDSEKNLYATTLRGSIYKFDQDQSPALIATDLFYSCKNITFGSTDDIIYVATFGGGVHRLEFVTQGE